MAELIHKAFKFKTHLKYQLLIDSNGRIGHLEEAAGDLSVAVEMTEEDDVKANLCQKLVSVSSTFYRQVNPPKKLSHTIS